MPCVNSNGQPVPGAFGYCPTGSTWKDNAVAEPAPETPPDQSKFGFNTNISQAEYDSMSEEDREVWLNEMAERGEKGTGIFGQEITGLGGVDIGPGTLRALGTTALAAGVSLPVIRYGINALKSNKGVIGKKLKDLMGKLLMKRSTIYPINPTSTKGWQWYNGLRGVDKIKATSLLSGGASIAVVMNQMGGGEAETTKPSGPQHMTDAQRMQQLDSSIPDKNAMQRLGANMKDPKWWHQSMSGLKGDTRLMRLGQLMDYYGKTPKQRDESTAPAELWAANEIAHEKNLASALSANSPDSYKWSYKNVEESLGEWFEEKFGTDWWGGKDRDALKVKFLSDVTDEKARYPTKNLKEIAEALLKEYPDRYL